MSYWESFSGVVLLLVSAGSSLLLGCVLAYLVNIPMGFIERHFFPSRTSARATALRRGVSMILAYGCVLASGVIVIRLIIPELYDCILILANEIPPYIEWFVDYLAQFDLLSLVDIEAILSGSNTVLPSGDIDWQSIVTKAIELFLSGFGGVMNTLITIVSTTISLVISSILGLIFSLYLLSGKGRIGSQISRAMKTYLKPELSKKIFYVVGVFDKCFHSFIVGQCTEAVILGLLCMIGMGIFGFPYATMIGTLIGFTALIPIAGAYIGAGVGAFMIFTVDPIQAALFILFIIVLQQLEGNIVYPRVVGASIGLPGIWVLTAITLGGGIAGIPGMLISVPLFASIYQLLGADVRRREAIAANAATPEKPPDKAEKDK